MVYGVCICIYILYVNIYIYIYGVCTYIYIYRYVYYIYIVHIISMLFWPLQCGPIAKVLRRWRPIGFELFKEERTAMIA